MADTGCKTGFANVTGFKAAKGRPAQGRSWLLFRHPAWQAGLHSALQGAVNNGLWFAYGHRNRAARMQCRLKLVHLAKIHGGDARAADAKLRARHSGKQMGLHSADCW